MAGSKPERILAQKLRAKKIKVITQKKINGHKVDLFIKPNLCIEVDGRVFHNYPYGTDKDHREEQWLRTHGYTVLRFWDSEILENVDVIVARISQYCNAQSFNMFTMPEFNMYEFKW